MDVLLGLVMDEDLTYMDHSKKVNNKLITKWAMICQYCNKNWGFNQKVLIQLIRTLFLSTLFYAGHIWINDKTMKEINTVWYKIVKSKVIIIIIGSAYKPWCDLYGSPEIG